MKFFKNQALKTISMFALSIILLIGAVLPMTAAGSSIDEYMATYTVKTGDTLSSIAAKYGKSTAQLCVRFALQNDVLPMPKSTSAAHIAANTEVFDFNISDEDMKTLLEMPLLGFSGFLPEEAPADALVAASEG